MFLRLKQRIEIEIENHFTLYLILFFVFSAGIIAGIYSNNALSTTQKQNALVYVNSAFTLLKQTKMDFYKLFISAIQNNAIFFIPLILAGLFTITIPLIFIILCAKGYLLGFSIMFIFGNYSFFGLIIVLLCVLIPSVFSISCYFLMAKKAVLNGIDKFKRRDTPLTSKEIVFSMREYIGEAMFMCIILCIFLLIESIIMPVIMSYILRLY